MDLKHKVFGTVHEMGAVHSQKNKNENLARVSAQAKSDGLQITFIGEYRMKALGSDVESVDPFVIAQDQGQIARLSQGVLQGRMYDSLRYATIKGTLSLDNVEFDKRYVTESLPPNVRKMFNAIRNIILPERKGLPASLKSTIYYNGTSQDGGNSFAGRWKYSSSFEDMISTEGPFTMKKI